jgi:hypothetical protein
VDAKAEAALGAPDDDADLIRPYRDGGKPAKDRELGRQGRETVRMLL